VDSAAYETFIPEEYRKSFELALDISGMAGIAYGGVKGVAALGSAGRGLLTNEIGAVGNIKNGVNVPKPGSTIYRYGSEAEVQAIKETGALRGGNPGPTYFTEDLYNTSKTAQKNLALKNPPEVRIKATITNEPKLSLDGTKVQPASGQPGGGTEIMSMERVNVKIENVKKLPSTIKRGK
jgi:hypothetical protein